MDTMVYDVIRVGFEERWIQEGNGDVSNFVVAVELFVDEANDVDALLKQGRRHAEVLRVPHAPNRLSHVRAIRTT
jgi:hypothetical protein